jgi:uncharacterized repeat protein (TIGR03803 family)
MHTRYQERIRNRYNILPYVVSGGPIRCSIVSVRGMSYFIDGYCFASPRDDDRGWKQARPQLFASIMTFVRGSARRFSSRVRGGLLTSEAICAISAMAFLVFAPIEAQGQGYRLLYNLCSASVCMDGSIPQAGLVRDAAGNLYGTTASGGASGNGAIFKLDSLSNETVLYSFCSVANCLAARGETSWRV